MLTLKVVLNQAEEVKKFLLDNNAYDKKYLPKKTLKHIFFPVIKEVKLPVSISATFEDIKLDKSKKELNYKELIKDKLSKTEFKELPNSYDIIGDIIILELKDSLVKHEKLIGSALLKTHKNIKTILKKSGVHSGEFRIQELEFVAGENKKVTVYKENNVKIKLDVEKIYFSPRSSTERKRIYKLIKPNEKVLVMFSGTGIYPIVISKNTQAKKIVAIEKNPIAHKYAIENLELNKITNIELFLGDVNAIIPKLTEKFDRILMPLPKSAETFLDLALTVSKKGTVIHFYDFEHESELMKGPEKVENACIQNKIKCKILRTVKCGQYSPGKFRICVDFQTI